MEQERARHFRETRAQRSFELIEDYTELIADLISSKGKARVCDIAKEMGISHVSVLKAINKLIRDGYLIKDENQILALTLIGEETAAFSKKKHLVLSQFLQQLGVPKEIAESDVEGIEHHISHHTLNAIETHLQKLGHSCYAQNAVRY